MRGVKYRNAGYALEAEHTRAILLATFGVRNLRRELCGDFRRNAVHDKECEKSYGSDRLHYGCCVVDVVSVALCSSGRAGRLGAVVQGRWFVLLSCVVCVMSCHVRS